MRIDEVDENSRGEPTYGFEVANGYLVITVKRDGLDERVISEGGSATLAEVQEAKRLVRERTGTWCGHEVSESNPEWSVRGVRVCDACYCDGNVPEAEGQ